MLPAIAK